MGTRMTRPIHASSTDGLTAPTGMPSASRRSSVRFPGFFSRNRVSNSLPYKNLINSQNKNSNQWEICGNTRLKILIHILMFNNMNSAWQVTTVKPINGTHLIIQITMDAHFGLCLPAEECIMEFLVVNINLSHLRSHSFPHPLLHRFLVLLHA